MRERYEKRNDLLARGVDKRLRERRKLLGWLQRELGERCGNATQATIAKIEAGVGNGVVPLQAATALAALAGRLGEDD